MFASALEYDEMSLHNDKDACPNANVIHNEEDLIQANTAAVEDADDWQKKN